MRNILPQKNTEKKTKTKKVKIHKISDLVFGRGGGRHIGHKLRVGGSVGRYTRYSKVLTPYTENWANNKTAEWYAGKKAGNLFYLL